MIMELQIVITIFNTVGEQNGPKSRVIFNKYWLEQYKQW